MRYKRFDVVELKNDNKATILDIKENNEYFVEIVDSNGTTIGRYRQGELDFFFQYIPQQE